MAEYDYQISCLNGNIKLFFHDVKKTLRVDDYSNKDTVTATINWINEILEPFKYRSFYRHCNLIYDAKEKIIPSFENIKNILISQGMVFDNDYNELFSSFQSLFL